MVQPFENMAEYNDLIIVNTSNDLSALFLEGTIIKPELASYSMMRDWLEACRTDPGHQRFCSLAQAIRPPGLRLIDVSTGDVVSAPEDACYVALSYVWGGDPSDGFAQVILDSMEVAKQLGYSYLWVDQHCIDQQDSADKLAQISNMHLVYGCADLTLVAAAGQDSSYGLPGVSIRSRIPPRFERLGDLVVLCPTPDGGTAMESSRWPTRGWTYQEAMLSRRRLVFTDYHVEFQCNRESFCEGLRAEMGGSPFELIVFNSSSAFNLGRALSEYSTRNLSHESDRLNAVLGILGKQESLTPPAYHIWGTPVQQVTEGWALALGWGSYRQQKPRRRNPEFPSWSWIGWAGPTE
ncbi:HET-domain-containing protein, partial [Triangularia verruculosa]